MKHEDSSSVHRFNDLVAVSLSSTQQLYLQPAHAHWLGLQLLEYAFDVNSVTFQQSRLMTRSWHRGHVEDTSQA